MVKANAASHKARSASSALEIVSIDNEPVERREVERDSGKRQEYHTTGSGPADLGDVQ